MTADAQALDQVRSYLATLSPRLRAKLVSEIETQRLKGKSEPAHEVVLNLVRSVMRSEAEEAKRTGSPERLFYEPLEPFLVDEAGSTKHKGFISRKSLDAVWRWLQREDSINHRIAVASDEASKALLGGEDEKAVAIMARLRADILPVLQEAIAAAAADPRQHMNLSMQLEGSRNLEDLNDIAAILRLEERLGKLVSKLANTIEDLDDATIGKIVRQVKDDGADLIYLLIAVYRRLEHPAQILRILTRFEGTDDGVRLSKSRFAPCADIVLAEIDFADERIAAHISRPAEFDSLLAAIRRFYALANGLSVAVELEGATDWRKRLAAHRRRASEILSAEVETIPGAVRRAMRPRRREGERIQPVPEDDVLEAEYAVRLMVGLKPYRAELAVNELLGTVASQIEKFVESANEAINHELRTATGAGVDVARSDLDVAVRINAIVFGESYAALLKRSGDVAGPMPSPFEADEDDDAGDQSGRGAKAGEAPYRERAPAA
jgi:hypothetical protein